MVVESSDRAQVAGFMGTKADTDTDANPRASSAIDNLNNMAAGMGSIVNNQEVSNS